MTYWISTIEEGKKVIAALYAGVSAKHPEKFSLELKYLEFEKEGCISFR